MGVDAVVYRNPVELGLDGSLTEIDALTGEILVDGNREPITNDIAIKKRIGNISQIMTLRSEISNQLPSKSLLLSVVLRDGTHSGDAISFSQLDLLNEELLLLRRKTMHSGSPELEQLIDDVDELIRVAKQQRNPIAFV